MLRISLLDCLMSVMSMEGDKIQNMTVILVCVILGSHGSDKKIPFCGMRCHLFWFFLKHDSTCSMPEDVHDSGHKMLPRCSVFIDVRSRVWFLTSYKFLNQLTDPYCHIFVKKIVSYCLLHIGRMLQSETCITFVIIRCF